MSDLINRIIDMEWKMFSTVNGEEHTACQEDPRTFEIMRRGQYEAWSAQALESYFNDLSSAAQAGYNLAREKYIRMMKRTDPAGYAVFKCELPENSEEKRTLVAEIWSRMAAETEEMRKNYPLLALGGRPLYAMEERQWPSVETYQTCEMMTYSENTLRLLLEHVDALEKENRAFAFEIQLHTVKGLGYNSLREAEDSMTHTLYDPGDGVDYATKGCPCRYNY